MFIPKIYQNLLLKQSDAPLRLQWYVLSHIKVVINKGYSIKKCRGAAAGPPFFAPPHPYFLYFSDSSPHLNFAHLLQHIV